MPNIDALCVRPAVDREPGPAGPSQAASAAAGATPTQVDYEICPGWIRYHYKDTLIADQLVALWESVGSQKKVARESFRKRFKALERYQWLVVGLGLLATFCAAWASREQGDGTGKSSRPAIFRGPNVSFLAMILTAVVTGLGSMAGFYDFRGDAARQVQVWDAMAGLQSRINDDLMEDARSVRIEVIRRKIVGWTAERDKALQQASEGWSERFRKDSGE